MLQKIYVVITGTIFFVMAIAHFLRMMFQVDVFIGTWAVPNWVSGTVVIVGLLLALIAFKSVREKKAKVETLKIEDELTNFEKPEKLPTE